MSAQPVERVGRIGQTADDGIACEALEPFVQHHAVEHDEAIKLIVQTDMHLIARTACGHGAKKRLGQLDDAAAADRTDRTPYKQSTHVRSPRLLSKV